MKSQDKQIITRNSWKSKKGQRGTYMFMSLVLVIISKKKRISL